MAERQQSHRFGLESQQVDARIEDLREYRRERRRGQRFALTMGLSGLGATVFAAYVGQPWVAGILGGGTLLSLVSAFLYDKNVPAEPTSPQAQIPDQKKPGDFAKRETKTDA